MQKHIVAAVLVSILIALSACDQDQLAGIIGGASPAPTVTVTNTPSPTATNTPTPEPTSTAVATQTATPSPSPTPSATAPSAESLLEMAIANQEAAESYHYDMQMDISIGGESGGLTFSGDYLSPDSLSGLLSIKMGSITIEMGMVMSGDKIYATDLETGEWELLAGEMDVIPGFVQTGILQTETYQPEDFESLTLIGVEEVDGRDLYHISGLLPESLLVEKTAAVDGDAEAHYMIGVDDGNVYFSTLTFDMIDIDSGESMSTDMSVTYSNYDQPVVIEIPEISATLQLEADEDLGILYELPADWTMEQAGEFTCAIGDCPELHLAKTGSDGAVVDITITAVDPDSLAFLEEVMSGPEYGDVEVGGLPARWREGNNFVEALLYLEPERALQIAGQWVGHPDQETVVRQIIASLRASKASSVESFKTYELPGWASVGIPDAWYNIRSSEPGWIALSSKDVDFPDFNLADGGAVVQLTEIDDPGSSLPDFLTEEYLPNLAYEWELLDEPKLMSINGQLAATVSYISRGIHAEQATVFRARDGSRTIMLLAVARESDLPKYEPIFQVIRDTVLAAPLGPGPEFSPAESAPMDSLLYSDEREAYEFSYPSTWQQVDSDGLLVLSPPTLENAAQTDSVVGSVIIYPPPMMVTTLFDEEVMVEALIDQLWMTGGWLIIHDAMMTSDISQIEIDGVEYAAAYFTATDEEQGGIPLYGFMGVVTNGESAVGMVSWVEDQSDYDEVWMDVFNSIALYDQRLIDRESATPINPGRLVEGKLAGASEQLYSFTAESGERYALITRIGKDGSGRLELFDPAGDRLVNNQYIHSDFPGLDSFTTPTDGEIIFSVNSAFIESQVDFTLLLHPVEEGQPGVAGLESSELEGSCREFGYANVEGETVVVHVEPVGDNAGEANLSIELLDSSREMLWGEYNPVLDGQTVAFEHALPDGGNVIVRVCETNDQPASFELIVLALEDN